MKLLFAAAASLLALASADSTFTPARPPSIPLAVRSPYLSTWQYAGSDSGNGGYLAGQWPRFWTGNITGWTGLVRVDGTTYTWMGAPDGPDLVNQTGFEYTSTRSTFTLDVAGLVTMRVTFLSPVFPEDMKRQSLVFSYMDVEFNTADGSAHNVSIYTDISAEWVSADKSAIVQWDYDTVGDVAYHTVSRQTQLAFSETSDQTDYGDWYYATSNGYTLKYQSGTDDTVRGNFIDNGTLDNSQDTNYRAINDDYPVFAFAVDLGSVADQSTSTLFAIGLAQEDAIQFDGADGVVPLPSLWKSYFDDGPSALEFFYDDYATSSANATDFDSKVATDSTNAGGQDYLTITSLSLRQAFGATQLVGTSDKTYLFLKEISSDGNVQTVDVIFPFHPVLMYTNPLLLKLLLDPLFENQESGQYPNTYSMHDLGSSYPNATGHPDGADEKQPLEECGNMLIMTLAYAQRANDVDYLSTHYDKLKQWNGYLVEEALIPADQISTDDFAGSLANQTDLALKGMIGIRAMAEIANQTGNAADYANFSSIAQDYITQWQDLGVAHDADPPHTTLAYGMNDTHGLLYNLFGDRELGLGYVPQSVYDMQSAFYPTVANEYGVPLDTRHNYTKSDWQAFVAAISSEDTQKMFYMKLATWIGATTTDRPLTDLYDTITGDYPTDGPNFATRPVVGGAFAQLALPIMQAARQRNGFPEGNTTRSD